MDVALQPPALGVGGGHDPLPGGLELLQPLQELLGQADVAKDQARSRRQVPCQVLLGRGQALPGGLGQGQGPQELPPVVHGQGQGSGKLREPTVGQGQGPGEHRFGRPRGLRAELGTHRQPHGGLGGPGPLGQDPGHAGQEVLRRYRPGHAGGELRQDLVGGGPPAVHQSVGQSLHPVLDRSEGQGHHRCGQDGQSQVGLGPLADQRSDPHHDGHVHRGDEPGQGPVDQGLVDDDVDVVQVVLEDRDARSNRNERDERRERAPRIGQHERRHCDGGPGQGGGVHEPLELQALLAARPNQPHNE